VRNEYHNGYPDLLPRGVYPDDSIAHGAQGGLEVKASRGESSWQSHGPRAGWFLVVQFDLDEATSKALQDREPTRVVAVMVAELEETDWSWQPAAEGRIRSGTASVLPSGARKLREGGVWVAPSYKSVHDERLLTARRDQFRAEGGPTLVAVLTVAGVRLRLDEIVGEIAPAAGVPPQRLRSTVSGMLKRLLTSGAIHRPARGRFSV
jgi:hypothetical protein